MRLRIPLSVLLLVVMASSSESESHSKVSPEGLLGLTLIDSFGCGACHGGVVSTTSIPAKAAPDLAWAAGRINPEYIEGFIADPLTVKPGTTMPSVMGGLSSRKRSKAAAAITHYLMSLGEAVFERQAIDAEAGARGRALFHSVGCVACHSPRDEDGSALLVSSSEPLPPLALKYNLAGLTAFLKDPLAVRPSGRMPNLQLTHWEALDIAHYLLETAEGGEDVIESFEVDAKLVEKGGAYFRELNCVQCHEIDGAKGREDFTSFGVMDTGRGCLSGGAGDWPEYDLDESERRAIRLVIARGPAQLTDEEEIDLALTTFNCLACHERGDLGGVGVGRDEYFETLDMNLGPQGRIPPTLTGVGAKLKPEWMRRVLVSGHTIRPYMKTRMPRFGAENVAHLIELFQRVDEWPAVTFAEFSDQKLMRNAGTEFVGTNAFGCIVCHTFQEKPAQTMQSVDMTEMAERLQKGWFYRYLKDPQGLSPGTVMPTFWDESQPVIPVENLDSVDLQIEAVWQFLLDGRQARTPHGLVVAPMELVVGAEAVMLRRKYDGIGKRGIGVGYPGQVNLAYDAEQMRIGMIWKGKFADPSGVWRSQGHGKVRVLGTDRVGFSVGPELDDVENPWEVDDGRPPRHQFGGYYLDAKRRPTFMYRFDEIDVEDYPVDVTDAETGVSRIRRTLTFSSAERHGNLAFRAATGETITGVGDNTYQIDERLRVRLEQDVVGEIIDVGDGKALRIPLEIGAGTTTLVLEYDW